MSDDLAWDDDEYEAKAKAGRKAGPGDKKAAAPPAAAAAAASGPVDAASEKLRLSRLQEASDLDAAREAFGGPGRSLDDLLPRSEQEFTEFGELLYFKYLRPHERNANVKAALKAMLRGAALALATHDLKELESCIIAVRNQKLKEEKEAQTKGKKATKGKPALKAGNLEGGDLEDAAYANAALDSVDDDLDFM